MKLSAVLDKYYVIPLGQSEIVGYDNLNADGEADEELIVITWTDSEGFDTHRQEFADQDIQLLDHPKGGFFVRDVDKKDCGFIALDGVQLETDHE